jgi:hypothetical protein
LVKAVGKSIQAATRQKQQQQQSKQATKGNVDDSKIPSSVTANAITNVLPSNHIN